MANNTAHLRRVMNPTSRVVVPSSAPIVKGLQQEVSIGGDKQNEANRIRVENARVDRERAREHRNAEDTDSALGQYVEQAAHDAFSNKCSNGIQDEQRKALMTYHTEFTCEELACLPDGGAAALYYPLIEMMTKRMYAFLTDTLSAETGQPTFDMRPTTIPDVPPVLLDRATQSLVSEIELLLATGVVLTETQVTEAIDLMADKLMEEAKAESEYAVRRCKHEVNDRLDATNYYTAYFRTLFDMVLFGTGVLYGPFPTLDRKAAFTSKSKPVFDYRKNLGFQSLDMTHFAPSPCSTDTQDGRYCVYFEKMSKSDLMRAASCDWHKENIDYILLRHPTGYSHCKHGQFGDIDQLRGSAFNREDKMYDITRYWGEIDGRMLIANNVESYGGQEVDPEMCYEVEVFTCAGMPIRIQQSLDPACKRPLHKVVMYECPGAFHGRGTYHRLKDTQSLINSAMTAIPYDLSFTAFPIFEVDKSLRETEDGSDEAIDLEPGSVHMKNSLNTGTAGNMIGVHQLQSHVNLFSGLIAEQIEHAETLLGLPRYLAGGAVGSGATRTASGLAQLQSNAFTNLKCIIRNVDLGLTKPSIEQLHRLIMVTSDNPDIFGDIEVVVLGHTTQLARQIHRDSLQTDLGVLLPFFQAGLIPVEGVMDILREFLTQGGYDPRKTIPDSQYEEAKARELQAAIATISNISGGVASSAAAGGALGGQQLTGGVSAGQPGLQPPQGAPQLLQ